MGVGGIVDMVLEIFPKALILCTFCKYIEQNVANLCYFFSGDRHTARQKRLKKRAVLVPGRKRDTAVPIHQKRHSRDHGEEVKSPGRVIRWGMSLRRGVIMDKTAGGGRLPE